MELSRLIRFNHLNHLRLFLSAATIASLFLPVAGCSKKEQSKGQVPVTEVVAVTVQPQTVPAVFPFVAQIQSSHQVDVMARVNGFLEKISYQEGEPVKQGQVLFLLDKKPFVAAVNAARAAVDIRKSSCLLPRPVLTGSSRWLIRMLPARAIWITPSATSRPPRPVCNRIRQTWTRRCWI